MGRSDNHYAQFIKIANNTHIKMTINYYQASGTRKKEMGVVAVLTIPEFPSLRIHGIRFHYVGCCCPSLTWKKFRQNESCVIYRPESSSPKFQARKMAENDKK
jgi:hypothetical protein